MADFDSQDIVGATPSSDFDSNDVVTTTPSNPPKQQAAPTGGDFHPDDVVSTGEPARASNPDYEDVRKNLNKGFVRSLVESPVIGTEVTTNKEIDAIAREHGVDPEALRQVAGYYGARREGPENVGEEALSSLTRGPLMGIPQFASKKAEEDPKFRAAVDDLRELTSNKRSMVQGLGEMLLPGGAVSKIGGGVLGKIAGGAATGAVYGTTSSREGEEAKGAALGAGLGGALGAGAAAIEAKLASKYKPNETELALHDKQSKAGQFDIEKGTQEIANRTADSEKILEDIGFRDKGQLSQQELEKVAEEQLGTDQYKKIMDPSSDEGRIYREKVSPEGNATERQIQEQIVNDVVDRRLRDFAEDLTGKAVKDPEEAMASIDKFSEAQGSEATVNRYRDFVKAQQAEKYIENRGVRAQDDPGFFTRAANFVSDSQYVLRHVDDKYGTQLQKIHSDLNKDYNRSTFALSDFRTKYDNIFKQAQKNGTDDVVSNSDKIYKAMDTGKAEGLTPQELETARNFGQYFEDIRNFVNGLVKEKDPRIAPLSIAKRENYVPHMPLQTPDMITAVEKRMGAAEEALGKPIADLSSGELKEAVNSNPDIRDVYEAAKWLNSNEVSSGRELANRMNQLLYTRNGNIAMETAARAAEERKGGIPEFLLERNLYKLARRYTDNTIRHLYLRNSVDKLRYEAGKLDKIGADVDSQYVRNLIQDLMGVRKGTAAEAQLRGKIELSRKLDGLINQYGKDSLTGGALTAVKSVPDLMYAMSRQIYPNLLGYFNIRAAVQNLTQPLTKTLPELGTQYGSVLLPRAAIYTVANLPRIMEKVTKSGNIPAEFTRAGELAIMGGIRKSSMYQIPARALEGMGKVGMKLFEASEKFNRALTTGASEMMAHDLANGSKLAENSINNFPPYLRQFIVSNRENQELVSQAISKYLNDTTQFNYNRISMSEFGRTMGPFFSTFSKWPTVTAGDMIYNIRDRGAIRGVMRNSEKYLLPFLALQGLDYAMGERLGSKEGLSDRQKKIVGAGGISQSAPIGTVSGFLTGQVFTPPAVDAIYKGIIQPTMAGKVTDIEPSEIPGRIGEVAGKTASSLAQSYLPGGGLIRLLTDDLVTYATGQRPEGSTFIERSIEGAKRIRK